METLGSMSAERLVAQLDQLVGDERRVVVEFLAHLAELERRHLHNELGYDSLFAYCTEHLKFAKASAWRRTTAARLMVQFPVLAEYLRTGRLCLTTVCLLRKVLDADNHVELLERAAGRTEEEVERLVATLRPQPAPEDMIRKLPAAISSGPELRLSSGPELQLPAISSGPELQPPAISSEPMRPAQIRPISAETHVMRVAVGPEFLQDLEQVRAALSHQIPGGELEQVLRACLRITLDVCQRRKTGAAAAKARASKASAKSRKISTAVRRQVWSRDEGRCTFVGTSGRRCGSMHQLQFHHIHPDAAGGPATVENVTLHCRAHNVHRARADFGEEHMAQFSRREPVSGPAAAAIRHSRQPAERDH